MSRKKKQQMEQNLKALDKPNNEDEIFKIMLEFRFDQPVTTAFVFEEDDDLDHFNEKEDICKVRSENLTGEKSPGSNNKIILGTKKISRKSKDKQSGHDQIEQTNKRKQNRCKRKTCNVDNVKANDEINIQTRNISHLSSNEMVSVPLQTIEDFVTENNHSVSEEALNSLPSIKLFTDKSDVTRKNLNSDDNTENSNIFNSIQSNYSEIIKNIEADTDMKIKNQGNTDCNFDKYSIKPVDAIKELDIKSKCDTASALNSTSYTGQENSVSVTIDKIKQEYDEIKQKYKTFPRTKVTSRRDIKKFPGKMDAMKKSMDKTTVPKDSSSLGTIDDIINAIPVAPSIPEYNVLKKYLTNPSINLQTNETEDLSKNLQYQKILDEIQHEVQRSMRPEPNHQENIGVPTTTQEEHLPYQKSFYDPRYEALKTVAENLLVVFPYLNHYMLLKNGQAQNKEAFSRAQTNFYRAKMQSFGLSYSTVVSFILPFKDNIQCMHEFYALVMATAREKKQQDVLPINLEILCSEMIGWTETKKMQMCDFIIDRQIVEASNLVPDKYAPVRNQKLTQSLVTPPNIPSSNAGNMNPSAKLPNTKARPSSLRFAAGPPGREIQISYDPNVHHPLSSPTVQSNQKISSQMTYRNQWTSPALTPNETVTASSNQAPWLTHNPLRNQYTSAPMVSTLPQQNMQLPTQTYPQAFQSFGSSRQPSSRPPKPSYEQIHREPQILHQKHQFEESAYNSRASVIQERSSVSRDSGFMSPVGDNSALEQIEQMDTLVNDLPANEECLTPMITHVTSMNPNATYTPFSKCHVCRTNTNLRCIGCNRIYYCGSQCQGLDWGTHKQICHK